MSTIEDLTKTQIILLTLLVSFVTSIATGIITTSLLAEAPTNVTQTINRVVERTIETVVPAPNSTREATLNKEDRLLLASVNKFTQAVVNIEEATENGVTTVSHLGVIMSQKGLVISSLGDIKEDKTYFAVLGDGTRVPLILATTSEEDDLAIFRIEVSPETGSE